MSEPVDQEIEAIKVVLAALAPLSEKARASVLDYVTRRLDLSAAAASGLQPAPSASTLAQASEISMAQPFHIETFKDQKKPRSANEMAALVAYYLANVAPQGQRKATVNQRDIETHFKIASFPLPNQVRFTLPNARNAGYFDLVGDGEYKLNAVGHNLVAHSMPRAGLKEGHRGGRRRGRQAARSSKPRQRKA